MRLSLVTLVLVLNWVVTSVGHACSFDTDCGVGSKCIKQSGQIYGICAGGMNPGNSNDQQPVYSPLDPNRTVGNTCQFDVDCGLGSRCFKSMGQIQGVCIR
jgi:hypothetical protein